MLILRMLTYNKLEKNIVEAIPTMKVDLFYALKRLEDSLF